MIIKSIRYPFIKKRLAKASVNGTLYQIYVEKDAEFKPSQYNNLFDSLYTVYNDRDPYHWLTFEFQGTTKGVKLYSWLSEGISQEFLQSNINSVHPAAEIEKVPYYKDYAKTTRSPFKCSCASLDLDSHYIFNLLQSDGERVGADMVASLCASMQNLDDDEEVWVQFSLRPINYRALAVASSYFEIYKKTAARPSKLQQPYSKWSGLLGTPRALAGAFKHALVGSAGAKEHNASLNSMQKKLEAGVFFDLNIRLICYHPNFERGRARLNTVISSFAPATDKNRFRPYTGYREIHRETEKRPWLKHFNVTQVTKFIEDYRDRAIPIYPVENYVTPPELATVLHFPSKNIPGIVRLRAKKLPVPEGIFQYNTIEDAWKDGAIVFGLSNFRGRKKYLAFKDINMLMQHLYCIGGTGSGKSYWLSFIALQLVKSNKCGLTFFDVKGDVADDLIAHLPEEAWKRIQYIDMQDLMMFMPLNFLRQEGMSTYNLATMIVSVFLKLNSEGSIKEHSQSILRRALIAVISTNPEGSILEVYRMFTDNDYLLWTVGKMTEYTDFPDVLSYWQSYANMTPKGRQTEAKAILNKLEIITQNELPRYSMCQRENLFNWRELLDNKAIIIVNFALDKNPKEIIGFFGTLFTAFISNAVFSRGDIPRDKRVPHVLFMDEFEIFVSQAQDIKKFLELARSYGLGLVMAHQSVEQVPDELMGMVEDNTFTQISLLIGTASAKKIKNMFPGVTEDDLTSMLQYTGYGRFKKINPHPFTFDSLSMDDYFPYADFKGKSEKDIRQLQEARLDKVKQWKDAYKRQNYKRLDEIKDDIQDRYSLTQKNKITDDDSAAVKAGKASGKIKKKGKVIQINERKGKSKTNTKP